jgi:hypothetical protein
MENITEDGAESKTKGVLEGAKEKLFGDDDDDDEKETNGSSGRSSRASSRSGSSRSRASTRGRSKS